MPTNKSHALRAKAAVSDMLDTFEHNQLDDDIGVSDSEALAIARSMLRGAQALIGKTWHTSVVFRGSLDNEIEESIERLNNVIKVLREDSK